MQEVGKKQIADKKKEIAGKMSPKVHEVNATPEGKKYAKDHLKKWGNK